MFVILLSLAVFTIESSATGCVNGKDSVQVYSFRFSFGTEVKSTLEDIVKSRSLQAVSIVTGLGSILNVTLNLAFQPDGVTQLRNETYHERFEVVTLSGTLSPTWSHLHTALGRVDGSTLSGHVVDMVVDKTFEVVLLENCREVYVKGFDDVQETNVLTVKDRL